MPRKKAIRILLVASAALLSLVLIIGVVFALTSSSANALAAARAAAVERGFRLDQLETRNFKLVKSVAGLLGEEAYVEFAVKDNEPMQTVRIDVRRDAFQPWWQVEGTSVQPPGR